MTALLLWVIAKMKAVNDLPAYGWYALLLIFPGFAGLLYEQKQMQARNVYETVGHDLAVYCQTTPSLMPTGFVGNAWLPKSVRQFQFNFYRSITSTGALMAIGGGFIERPYGYQLELDPTRNNNRSNFWHLKYLGDNRPRTLYSFYTATSEVISLSNYVANTLAEYDRLAMENADAEVAIFNQQNRINFLLQFDRSKVRDGCIRAIQQWPDDFWPQLTLAFIDASQGRYEEATRALRDFIESTPGYSRYLILSFYYQQMNKPKEAIVAIEKALQYPLLDMKYDFYNATFRGYWAGVYAYNEGAYRTAIKVVDTLLSAAKESAYAKDSLIELRNAAESADRGLKIPFKPSGKMLSPFTPYERVSLRDLMALP